MEMIKEKSGNVLVATPINDVQLVEYAPSTPLDEKADIIVTPTKIIRVEHDKR